MKNKAPDNTSLGATNSCDPSVIQCDETIKRQNTLDKQFVSTQKMKMFYNIVEDKDQQVIHVKRPGNSPKPWQRECVPYARGILDKWASYLSLFILRPGFDRVTSHWET